MSLAPVSSILNSQGAKHELLQDHDFWRGACCGALQRTIGGVGATAFRNYRCADGTQFMAAFFQYDSRAHLQLDGKAVTLPKRVALSGSRYSGKG